jgi:hypothetical protein
MIVLRIRLGSVRVSQTIGTWAGVMLSTAVQERIFMYVRLGCIMSGERVNNALDVGGP